METTGIQFANLFGQDGIFIIVLIGLVLFGGKKIGELGKGLGEGIRNFKTAMKSDDEKKIEETKVEETKQA
jgi:sec-independent protein translocase protein TatA